MSEHEVRGSRSLYDHETEDARPGGRRRRPVADWGVGDEMFDHLPRRRFRTTEGASPRRDGHPRERQVAEPAPPAPAPEAPRLDPYAETAEFQPVSAQPQAPARDDSPEHGTFAEIDTLAHPGEGRRTIVIRGRGAEPAMPPGRSRPPRTAGERIGPRPERLAAWAVALGVLLILIAILTAH